MCSVVLCLEQRLNMTDTLEKFKIVIWGGGQVGKTALTIRFVLDKFFDKHEYTTTESFYLKTITVDDRKCQLDISDTFDGNSEFTIEKDRWNREGDGFIFVY